jgi:hypothetical protein
LVDDFVPATPASSVKNTKKFVKKKFKPAQIEDEENKNEEKETDESDLAPQLQRQVIFILTLM